MSTYYFAYGSNMRTARITARVGEVQCLGPALLRGYRHAFNKYGRDGTAKGNIEPAEDEEVYGVLYKLDVKQFTELIRFEGGYRVIEVSVVHGENEIAAVSFSAHKLTESLQPSPEYLEHYRQAAVEHPQLQDYVSEIISDES